MLTHSFQVTISTCQYDALDRRVHTGRSGNHVHDYALNSMYDNRQEVGQWTTAGEKFRRLTYLPMEEQGLPYGELISQKLYYPDRHHELNPYGHWQRKYSSLWYHQDSLGSTKELTDDQGRSVINYGYNPWGKVYTYHSTPRWSGLGRRHLGRIFGKPINPYLYTGKHTDSLTGLVHMDARFYDPGVGRFIQPDVFNFTNLALPQTARHELLQYTGLQTRDLLLDQSQQMRYGYVSGNPLRWNDPLGLADACIVQTIQGILTTTPAAAPLVISTIIEADPVVAIGLVVGGMGYMAYDLITGEPDPVYTPAGGDAGGDSLPLTVYNESNNEEEKPRFIGDEDGEIVDTETTPPGSYDQPNGGRTDILQEEDHGSGLSHTHNPNINTNPTTGESFINGLNQGDPVSAEDVDNITSGAATPSKPKGR